MIELDDLRCNCTRRHFLSSMSLGLGVAALSSLLTADDPGRLDAGESARRGGLRGRRAADRASCEARDLSVPERRPVAARSVRLQAAAANDERPGAAGVGPHGPAADGHDGVPEVVPARRVAIQICAARSQRHLGQRAAAAHGTIVDELCIVKSMHTEAINHDPAVTFFQTGSQQAGRPSIGAWLTYGLGSENENLPAFVVLISRARSGDQPLYSRLWGSRLSAVAAPGRAVPRRQGSGAVPLESRGHRPQRSAAHAGRVSRARAGAAREGHGPRDRRAHRAVRDGVPDADLGPRGRWTSPTSRITSRSLRPRRAEAGHLRGQLPAGAAAGRARRAVHPALSRAGTSTATCPRTSRR